MTTGNVQSDEVWKTHPQAGPLHLTKTRIWSGGDSPNTYVKHERQLKEAWLPELRYKDGRLKRAAIFTWKRDKFKPAVPKRARAHVPHPYSVTGSIVRQDACNVVSDDGYDLTLHLTHDASSAALDPWTSNDDLKLIDKLRDAVAGSSFNAGIVLGEGKKTLKMVGDTTASVARAIHFARRGDFVSSSNELLKRAHLNRTGLSGTVKLNRSRKADRLKSGKKTGASNWLELQYGWKPLLQDIVEGMEFVHHQLSTPARVRVVVTRYAGGVHPSRNMDKPAVLTGTNYCYLNSKVVSSGRIIASIYEKDVVALSGLTDPLSVAWELLPYSFIADWFVPIGSYLSARGLVQSLTGTFITTRKFRSLVRGPVWYQNTTFGRQWTVAGNRGSDFRSETWAMTRTIDSSISVPYPSIKPLGQVASWQHAANAVALVINAGRKL